MLEKKESCCMYINHTKDHWRYTNNNNIESMTEMLKD